MQFTTMREAWNACKRGDWMLSMAGLLKIDKRKIVGAAGRCAATVKHLMTDERSLAALDACEKFMSGEIGETELGTAAARAIAAARAVTAACAAYAAAATAATYAAAVSCAATYAAAAACAHTAAAACAHTAAAARDVDYAADAYTKNSEHTAEICRDMLTEAVFAALEAAEGLKI